MCPEPLAIGSLGAWQKPTACRIARRPVWRDDRDREHLLGPLAQWPERVGLRLPALLGCPTITTCACSWASPIVSRSAAPRCRGLQGGKNNHGARRATLFLITTARSHGPRASPGANDALDSGARFLRQISLFCVPNPTHSFASAASPIKLVKRSKSAKECG